MDDIQLIHENVIALRRSTNEPIELEVYKDRAIVSIKKVPSPLLPTGKQKYRFHVVTKFVYNNTQMETTMGYHGLKKALKHADDIFRVRNANMIKHDTRLYI